MQDVFYRPVSNRQGRKSDYSAGELRHEFGTITNRISRYRGTTPRVGGHGGGLRRPGREKGRARTNPTRPLARRIQARPASSSGRGAGERRSTSTWGSQPASSADTSYAGRAGSSCSAARPSGSGRIEQAAQQRRRSPSAGTSPARRGRSRQKTTTMINAAPVMIRAVEATPEATRPRASSRSGRSAP